MVVLQELRVLGKHRALVRIFNVALQLHHSVLPGIVKQFVQHLQRFQIERLAIWTRFQDAQRAFDDLDNDGQRVGDQQCSDGRPTDDYQFGGLNQDPELTLFHQETRQHGPDHD